MGAGNVYSIGNDLIKISYPHYPHSSVGKFSPQSLYFFVDIIFTEILQSPVKL